MTTECTQFVFGFHPQKRREIRAQFDGGAIGVVRDGWWPRLNIWKKA
jgi:hypothetical protein